MRFVFVFLASLFFTGALLAEVSAFGAGDLKSDNPYGLSESEKVIYSNKKEILRNSKMIKALNIKTEQLNESIEGLRSVVASLNDKVGQTGQRLSQLAETKKSDDEIESLKARINEQDKKYNALAEALKKLTLMMDDLNSRSGRSSHKTSKRTAPDNSVLLKKAIKTFRNKKYEEAFDMFETLDIKNYKRATANFYMGECSYYMKRYEDAIIYFKKSAGLYDKASYMPTLMLHTGLSFKKSGDGENAKRFLDAVIQNYPKSSQAKIAKKNL